MSLFPLYHGTSSRHLEAILRDGLQPRTTPEGNWPDAPSMEGRVYLSTWLPLFYAGSAIEEGDSMLVLRVEVAEENLWPDEDWFKLARVAPNSLGRQAAAKRSLAELGCVASLPLPAGAIREHRVVPFDIELWGALGGDAVPSSAAYRILGSQFRERLGLLFSSGPEAVRMATRAGRRLPWEER